MPAIGIVGTGPVAVALAKRLTFARLRVLGMTGRTQDSTRAAAEMAQVPALGSEALSGAGAVIFALRESQAGPAAFDLWTRGVLGASQCVLHTSGAWPAHEVFAALPRQSAGGPPVATFHPLLALNRDTPHTLFEGAGIALQGDADATAMAAPWVHAMGARSLRIAAEDMALYHAAAALASNALVALAQSAATGFSRAGVGQADLVSVLPALMKSSLANVEHLGLSQALTGPIARGDVATVEKHLRVLDTTDRAMAAVYRALGQQTLLLAHRRNPQYDPAVAARMAALIAE